MGLCVTRDLLYTTDHNTRRSPCPNTNLRPSGAFHSKGWERRALIEDPRSTRGWQRRAFVGDPRLAYDDCGSNNEPSGGSSTEERRRLHRRNTSRFGSLPSQDSQECAWDLHAGDSRNPLGAPSCSPRCLPWVDGPLSNVPEEEMESDADLIPRPRHRPYTIAADRRSGTKLTLKAAKALFSDDREVDPKEEKEETVCAICLEAVDSVDEKRSLALPCRHTFHPDCIRQLCLSNKEAVYLPCP